MFKFVFIFSFLFLTILFPLSAIADDAAYYDNAEAKKIAGCIRNHIQSAAAPKWKDDLHLGERWVCKQLMYLWDEAYKLNVLVARNDSDHAIFQFVENEYSTEADKMVDNATPLSDDKKRYGFVDNAFHRGYFSHTSYGPAPHRHDYLTFKDGYLFWEESVRNAKYNERFFPDLSSRPFSVWESHAGVPEKYKRRVTTYGVCYPSGSGLAQNAPCF